MVLDVFGYVFAITEINTPYGWGINDSGQLGRGRSDENYFPSITNIDVRQMSCGSHHIMVISNDGFVYGWGDNNHGQVGLGNQTYDVLQQTKLDTLKKLFNY